MQCQAVINLGPHVATYCVRDKGHEGKCQASQYMPSGDSYAPKAKTQEVTPRPRQFACGVCSFVFDFREPGTLPAQGWASNYPGTPVCDDCHKGGV